MQFDYLYEVQATGSIEIEDVGNFAISITSDIYEEYFMVVVTQYGMSHIIQYGPINIEIDELPDKVCYSYQRIEYNQSRLSKIIDKYINDSYKHVTQVTLIDIEDVKSNIKDLLRYVLCQKNL